VLQKLKSARRMAIRYGKTAENFLGFIDIASIQL
jgi:transposase